MLFGLSLMRLDLATWLEVGAYLDDSSGIFLPAGSTEQHGPMGLIGTDVLCAELIATKAAEITKTYVAPTLAYTPAPFNTSFPGTLSVSETVFEAMVRELFLGLIAQGFCHIYVVNGHGANIRPIKKAASDLYRGRIRVMSWWDFNEVDILRRQLYGEWEGMHATPSEISITQTSHRIIPSDTFKEPPEALSANYLRAHSGDRHGPPEEHRKRFPDGRIGSHSALAHPEHGKILLDAATTALVADYYAFRDAN